MNTIETEQNFKQIVFKYYYLPICLRTTNMKTFWKKIHCKKKLKQVQDLSRVFHYLMDNMNIILYI